MSTDFDTLLLELASIQDQLLKEPPLEERAILHSRQEELRSVAKELRGAVRDDLTLEQARVQLAHLEERRAALIDAMSLTAATPRRISGAEPPRALSTSGTLEVPKHSGWMSWNMRSASFRITSEPWKPGSSAINPHSTGVPRSPSLGKRQIAGVI
jgi:hypothetical protein